MTEQEKKTRFKQAIDSTLSGIEGDPFLYQRVIANAEKGEKKMKYAVPKGIVIALIVILCMGTVAVAASVYGGTTNWNGDIIYDEQPENAYPTMAPQELEAEIDRSVRISNWVAEMENDGELLAIYEMQEDGEFYPSTNNSLKRTAKDMESFKALLKEAYYLPLPNFIPDGYEFVQGVVMYTCREGGEWRLANQMELEKGVKAEWYQLDAEDAVINGYELLFRSSPEDYHYLSIYVGLSELVDVSEQSFGFIEGQTVQIVDVSGMDNALAITSENNCSLSMRRVLEEPIRVQRFHDWERQEISEYAEVQVDVRAPMLDVDTLVRMFVTE